ncbi:MAG TPA: beta-N-acetylhexosaminidase [Alphaproteobacteria bacterium]|nr:beta-N-acetylhexosaminidase [Alphaproteobacteria bacterium]
MHRGQAVGLPPRAVIFGCAGPELSDWERRFFAKADPLGFILFQRNCIDPAQVRRLVAGLRESVGRAEAPVLIDQEGGRVLRLKPPHWRAAPAQGEFGDLAGRNAESAHEAAYLNARLLAVELAELGITVDCAPVLDLRLPGAHEVIGDRALGSDPVRVAELGAAVAQGLLDGGVLPVIKHIPGHGRATLDSHHDLPVVDAGRELLERTDFEPFRRLSSRPWAMTAHIVYRAIDPKHPASLSKRVIEEVVRGSIGFQGFLVSDDVTMKALKGEIGELARRAVEAGCDGVLHCTGDAEEMERVALATPRLSDPSLERLARAAMALPQQRKEIDLAAALDRIKTLLAA